MTTPATTPATIPVHDPRTGAVDLELVETSPAEVAAAVAELRAAQPAWEALGPAGRGEVLLRWRDAVAKAEDELVDALVRDTGRVVESRSEHAQVLGKLDHWAAVGPGLLEPDPEIATKHPGIAVATGYRPYPVVGVISPWNFPLLLGLIDAVPALMAGSTVIAKPSEVTPRFVEPLARTIAEVPELAAVLRVVDGAAVTGQAMVGSVDLVVFTGSVPTGRLVAQGAARAMIPAFLELGGKDPVVVLAGSDLDRATSAILWGATANAGQSCLSIERVYVDRRDHDAFVDLLVRKAATVQTNGDDVEVGRIGPLIDPAQAAVVERHLADALARGATVRQGGTVERRGGAAYCPVTVLTDVDHSMLVMTEETFGPLLPVMAFDGADEAVALANDTVYGLSAAVFGPDEPAATAVARRIEAGGVSVNDAALTALVHDGAKHSFGASGLGGSRMGDRPSLHRFLRRQAFLVNRTTDRDPWWYPGA